MDTSSGAHRKRLVLLLWILVAFFYFYLSYDYIRITMSDQEFADYLQYVVQIAGTEHRPSKEVRALVLIKAEQLRLPLTGGQINIVGGGESLNIEVAYKLDIEFPLLQKQVYTKEFHHRVQFKQVN